MTVRIIVATHKPYRMPSDPMYLPVHAGAAGKESIGYRRDDEGENISSLNSYFCELTALYWGWKNLDADYVGLAHYRRHFSSDPHCADVWEHVLKENDIADDLGRIRVFVPGKRRYWIETLYTHYAHTHYRSQLDETRKIIREHCPDYLKSFDKAVSLPWGYMFNMMIMEKEMLNRYCTWLFEILFELKERLGENGLSAYQGRYYGRISEIIFNAWLKHQTETGTVDESEIREIPFVHMEKVNRWKKGKAFLMAKFAGRKYGGSF